MITAIPPQSARAAAHIRGRAPLGRAPLGRAPPSLLPILALAMVGAGAASVYALWTLAAPVQAAHPGGVSLAWIAVAGLLGLGLLSLWLLARERRRGEAVVDGWRQSEERLRAIVDNSPAAVYVKDAEGRYRLANRRFERLYRLPDAELLGKTDAEIFPDEVAAALRAKDRKVLETDEPVHYEVSIPEDDGAHTYLSIGFPLHDAQGRVTAVGAIATDITQRRRLEAQLRDSEAHLRQIIDLVPEMVFAKDREGRFVLANRAAADAYGTTVEALLGRDQRDLHEPAAEVHQMLVDDLEVIESGQRKFIAEEVFTDWRGQRRVLQSTRLPFILPGSNQRAVLGVAVDISERKRIELALFEEKERAQVTLQAIADAVVTTDAEGRVGYLNPVAAQLTGWTPEAAWGRPLQTILELIDEHTRQPLPDLAACCLQEPQRIDPGSDVLLIGRAGAEYAIQPSAAPIRDRDDRLLGMVVVFRDLTEARRRARKIAHQAAHDPLTGLPNRREFELRVQRALDSAKERGLRHALCYLDLDQFKSVNDTAGHAAGDELLKQIAGLLANKLRSRDTVARLGGDEFGLLLENCPLNKALEIAETIVAALRDFRFLWEGCTFKIGASAGLVSIGADSEDVGRLMTQADLACYNAKDLGRNRVCMYRLEDREPARHHNGILRAAGLLEALERDRFRLYCQPVVPLTEAQGAPLYYEVLLRLLDPGDELVLPGAFIPPAERHGLMAAIDRWVIRTALRRYVARFGAESGPGLALNLSRSALDDEALIEFIQRQLAESGASPERLCFEIAETVAINHPGQTLRFVQALKKSGCRFTIDDFGSGSSSFSYIKELPVDHLKIGGRFVRAMLHDPIDHAMVVTIKQVGDIRGLQTIAECVENPETAARLRELGVDYAQGYALGHPQPLETIRQVPAEPTPEQPPARPAGGSAAPTHP